MTSAISWATVSSKPQADRESLHDQHRLNHALAEAPNWELVADITVPGESRSYYRLSEAQANLDAYQELSRYASDGTIDWLIVKSRDRLARTRRLNRAVADFLSDHNIRVYSRTMPPSSTDERTEADVWGEAIESGYSEAKILRLKQRREMRMQARVRSGKIPSNPPWGFRRIADEQGRLSYVFTDPRAEQTITLIVNRYLAGVSINNLIRELQDKGCRTATGKALWSTPLIRKIVTQPNYCCLVAWGKTRAISENGRQRRANIPPEKWLIAEGDFDSPFTPDD